MGMGSSMSRPPSYQRVELGGIPCIVGAMPGPARVALLFRVGFVDEEPSHRGWTHLVEHLALGPFAPADNIEGNVAQHATTFIVQGSDEDVVGQLGGIAARLRRLPVERLATELRVLRVEAESDANSGEKELALLHYGYTGLGRASIQQLGLRRVEPKALQEYANAWFTRENAALVLSRPVSGLSELELASGKRRLSPPAMLLPRQPGAAERAMTDGPVAVGGPLEYSPAAAVLTALLERRAWEVLRYERGLVYDVRCRLTRVAPAQRLLLLTCDARAWDASAAARALLALIDEAVETTTPQVAAAQADIRRRQVTNGFLFLLAAAAFELAEGRSVPADWWERLDRVTAEDVHEVARRVRPNLLVSLPFEASAGLPAMERTRADAVTGKAHPTAANGRERGLWDVVVGPNGVTATQDGDEITVRFDACIAAVADDEGALVLIAADESELVIHPTLHQDGEAAVRYVLNVLPSALAIPPEPPESRATKTTVRVRRNETAPVAVSRWLAKQLDLRSGTTTSPKPIPEQQHPT